MHSFLHIRYPRRFCEFFLGSFFVRVDEPRALCICWYGVFNTAINMDLDVLGVIHWLKTKHVIKRVAFEKYAATSECFFCLVKLGGDDNGWRFELDSVKSELTGPSLPTRLSCLISHELPSLHTEAHATDSRKQPYEAHYLDTSCFPLAHLSAAFYRCTVLAKKKTKVAN